jgi:hypothetical protein
VDAQVHGPQGSLIDIRARTRIEEDIQPGGGIRASGEHASNEICGTVLIVRPKVHRIVDLHLRGTTGTVREPSGKTLSGEIAALTSSAILCLFIQRSPYVAIDLEGGRSQPQSPSPRSSSRSRLSNWRWASSLARLRHP